VKSLSIRGVYIDRLSRTPVVTLREEDAPRRQFEIFIGVLEAEAIRTALADEQAPRPLTHDLFVETLEKVSVAIVQVVLTHVTDGTYFADLVLMGEDQKEIVVSARPSDALALALRAHCPIYGSAELLDMVGEVPAPDEATQQSEIIDEFRDFIENISPEDFE